MGVFKRISDVMSANLNDMIESWEEPEQNAAACRP